MKLEDAKAIGLSVLYIVLGLIIMVTILLVFVDITYNYVVNPLINSAQEHPSEYTAIQLYGSTVEREPIFADSSGRQYVIPWLDYISPDEVILIKTIGNEITEVYIQQEIPAYE